MGPFQRSIILTGLSALLTVVAPPLFGSHDIACAQASGSPNSAADTAEYNQLVLLYNNRHYDSMAERGPPLWRRAAVSCDRRDDGAVPQGAVDARHVVLVAIGGPRRDGGRHVPCPP